MSKLALISLLGLVGLTIHLTSGMRPTDAHCKAAEQFGGAAPVWLERVALSGRLPPRHGSGQA